MDLHRRGRPRPLAAVFAWAALVLALLTAAAVPATSGDSSGPRSAAAVATPAAHLAVAPVLGREFLRLGDAPPQSLALAAVLLTLLLFGSRRSPRRRPSSTTKLHDRALVHGGGRAPPVRLLTG